MVTCVCKTDIISSRNHVAPTLSVAMALNFDRLSRI